MKMRPLFSALSPLPHLHTRPFHFTFLSSLSSLSKTSNPLLSHFLINTLHFSECHAFSVASRFHYLKSLERPQALLQYFQTLGFSDKQIHSSVRGSPGILVLDVDKIIKPKIEYLQQLGFSDSQLGDLVSRASQILCLHFERKLVPCVEFLKNILVNNENLLKALCHGSWLISVDMNSVLLPNVRFLESCGIVGSQLAMLLRSNPRIFTLPEADLRSTVARVTDMGFDIKSRMLVHALNGICSCNAERFERKIEAFARFGFSRDEYMKMARKKPYLLKQSVEKSIVALEFYLNTLKLQKEVLVRRPTCLLNSMENRVIPRYSVLEIIKSKRLLKKEPSFLNVLDMKEKDFIEKYISKFAEHTEELLVAYKGHILDSSSDSEEEMSTRW